MRADILESTTPPQPVSRAELDSAFLEQLVIHAAAGHWNLIMRKLKARVAGHHDINVMRNRPTDPRDLTLAELGLDLRTANALENAEWLWGKDEDGNPRQPTAGLLCKWTAAEIQTIPSIGAKGIRQILAAVRLAFRGEDWRDVRG